MLRDRVGQNPRRRNLRIGRIVNPAKTAITTQRLFPFLERQQRLERTFKRAIVVLTALVAVGLIAGTPRGRFVVAKLGVRAKWAAQRLVGLEPSQEDLQADRHQSRLRNVATTRETYRAVFNGKETSVAFRRALEVSGMAPDNALISWSNYDWTVVLSSKVFEADDHGRYYRLLPNTRSCWIRHQFMPHGLFGNFLLPDTPEVRDAVARCGLEFYTELAQTTNSWGCRGPEPDPAAPFRLMVLGDSYMQGFFVTDDQTAPECLGRNLSKALGLRVSVLNTGHLGYSPEQYYYTFLEYVDRFKPHFAVISTYTNDFGDAGEVLRGGGAGWDEGKYWINEIQLRCRSRDIGCLIAAIPDEGQLVSKRNAGHYPGRIANLSEEAGPFFIDPTDEFIAENLRLKRASREGTPHSASPLYNRRYDDGHFSLVGTELWSRLVAQRVVQLLENSRNPGKLPPALRAKFGL